MKFDVKQVKELGKLGLDGFIANSTPGIVKGVINELLTLHHPSIEKICATVEKNASLWDLLGPHQEAIENALGQVPDLSWFTSEWFIEACKERHPAIASLFMGWAKAHNWLTRQIEMLKR